jgi:hypothetical protein
MDLLCEQVKMLAGELALCTSSLKRLSEEAGSNPDDSQLRVSLLLLFSHEEQIQSVILGDSSNGHIGYFRNKCRS